MLLLAFGGLAAGAITAGIAAVALAYAGVIGSLGTATPPPPPLTRVAEVADAGTTAVTDAATTETAAPTDPMPPATTTETPHHRTHHATHAESGGTTPPPSSTTTTAHTHTAPPPDPATDPLGAAQRALSDGSAAECVEILSGLISGGGTPIALRRRADCLMRLGRRDEAIADYQRFCRLAPDHPAIPEVRATLEGMGRTCP
jgi:hypothetical protein